MEKIIYSVEDDDNIRYIINKTLPNSGYQVNSFTNGDDLFLALEKEIPSVLLLDIMLPGDSGLEILAKLKAVPRYKDIYVIIVSAKSSELDKVIGLDSGADDYITKPFGVLELTSKINAIFRRHTEEREILRCRDIVLNVDERICQKGSETIPLTAKEFQLLKFLIEHKPTVVTKEELLKKVWGYSFAGETRTVDMHIKSLRQKLEDGSDNKMIITVHSVGYKIVEWEND